MSGFLIMSAKKQGDLLGHLVKIKVGDQEETLGSVISHNADGNIIVMLHSSSINNIFLEERVLTNDGDN